MRHRITASSRIAARTLRVAAIALTLTLPMAARAQQAGATATVAAPSPRPPAMGGMPMVHDHGHHHAHDPAKHGAGTHDAGMHEAMRAESGSHQGGGLRALLRGVNLTEDQRDKVFTILHGRAPALREQRKILRNATRDLRALAVSAQYDEMKARMLAQSIGAAVAESARLRADSAQAILRLLTPEQRQVVADNQARQAARRSL